MIYFVTTLKSSMHDTVILHLPYLNNSNEVGKDGSVLTRLWADSDVAICRFSPVNRSPRTYTEHVHHGLNQPMYNIAGLVR